MAIPRRALIRYFEQNGFVLLREGKKHPIYTNGDRTIPVKRHLTLGRTIAKELCKQAGPAPKF